MSLRRISLVSAQALVAISLPFVLLLAGVDAVSSRMYIQHEYGLAGFPPSQLYPQDERLRLAQATLHYLRSAEGEDYLRSLQHAGAPVYNEREVQHLVDVKEVMGKAFAAERISILICCVALAWLLLVSRERKAALTAVVTGCIVLWGMAFVIGVAAATNFDLFFAQFHRLFFAEGTWTFYVTDTLIQLFPLRFWMDATWKLGALALGSAALLGGVCYWAMKEAGIGQGVAKGKGQLD